MRRLLAVFTILAAVVSAQETKRIQKVYEVKYVDVRELANVIAPPNNEYSVRPNEHFKTISLYGPPEQLAAAEELIKRFDVSRSAAGLSKRNVELTCYILVAAPKGSAGEAVPADLDPVVRQLKSAFGYADFRLLDSAFIRAQEGNQLSTSGNTAAPNPEMPSLQGRYNLNVRRGIRILPDDRGTRVRLDSLVFELRLPATPGTTTDINFATDVDIREGQKVVVGKAKGDASNGAYILVLSARVVD